VSTVVLKVYSTKHVLRRLGLDAEWVHEEGDEVDIELEIERRCSQ
jgi:hypothetical protein